MHDVAHRFSTSICPKKSAPTKRQNVHKPRIKWRKQKNTISIIVAIIENNEIHTNQKAPHACRFFGESSFFLQSSLLRNDRILLLLDSCSCFFCFLRVLWTNRALCGKLFSVFHVTKCGGVCVILLSQQSSALSIFYIILYSPFSQRLY